MRRTQVSQIAAVVVVALIAAFSVAGTSGAQTDPADEDLPAFCARLTKVQGKLALAGSEQDTAAEAFTRMRRAARAFDDAAAVAPKAIRADVRTVAGVFVALSDGLAPLQDDVRRAMKSNDPEKLQAIGDEIESVLDEVGRNETEIAAAADRLDAWARDRCGITWTSTVDDSSATSRAPTATTSAASVPSVASVPTAAAQLVAASAVPAQTTPSFTSNGDYISGWYWLRDSAHADTGRWVMSVPAGSGDVVLTLNVLATSGVNGPRDVNARFFLSYGPGTSGAAAGSRLVTLQNVSPASDPVGYTNQGTVTIPRSAFPAGTTQMWVEIGRRDASGATVDEHIAVNAGSVTAAGGGGGGTTTTTGPPVTTTTVPPTTTTTRPLSGTPTIVSMGDSFISGEAGRWNGNSINFAGCRDGTDRGCRWEWVDVAQQVQESILVHIPFLGSITQLVTRWVTVPVYMPTYDEARVYGTTGKSAGGGDGCHRSDTAEINAPGIPVAKKVNIACSGAVTDDLLSAASGGTRFKGEQQQVDQLRTIADQTSTSTQKNQVRMIVVSIGGNDLRFSDIVKYCGWKYLSHPDVGDQPDLFLCADDTSTAWSPIGAGPGPATLLSTPNLDLVAQKVEDVVDDIRNAMADAGYSPSQYRIVLQSYPSPIPGGADMGFPASGGARTLYGCPFWDSDATWARDTLVPTLANRLEQVATTKDVAFLDIRDLFEGREICSVHATTPTPMTGPDASRSEWARVIMTGLVQGEQQESIHPNAYGQQALQRCLENMYSYAWDQNQPTVHLACKNTLGQGIDGVYTQVTSP